MQSEHHLDHRSLTAEYIKSAIDKSESDELTCLVPGDDERAGALLREGGFRYVGKRLVEGKVMTVFKWFRGLAKHEDMASFFDRRVADYDLHMSDGNDSYESTFISLFEDVPKTAGRVDVLDLGCGTGAELKYLFQKAPNARVVGMDVSEGMLWRLRETYRDRAGNIDTIRASYVGTDLGEGRYDCVVACSTLHHLLAEDKSSLYVTIKKALREAGYLLISDFVAETVEDEQARRKGYLELVEKGAINRSGIYHIDLNLTLDHEVDLLKDAGLAVTRMKRLSFNQVIIAARSQH